MNFFEIKTRYITIFVLVIALAFSLCACGDGTEDGDAAQAEDCYAIIAALDFEEELIRDQLEDMEETELLSTPVYTGTIGSHRVVLMRCGMGKVSAGIGAQALIDEYHPDYVINTGCAGALSPELGIGDVVLSKSVVEWDLDLQAIGYPLGYIDALDCVEMKADRELCDRIAAVIPDDVNIVKGMVVSGDQFVSTNEQRAKILANFPDAQCAEMEGAAVGHVCRQNRIPFCIIRTMSDTADGNSGVDYGEFSIEASKKSAAWLVDMLSK